ncbi:MAG: gamma-glutamyltransferase [Polyangiaceae bacterium]
MKRRASFVLALLLSTSCGGDGDHRPAVPAASASESAQVASASASSAPSAAPPITRSLPKGKDEAPRVALGTHGAVASQEANATDIGLAVLKKGGNAVDAAIAVAFALAVTHPIAGNIGGGGFMVVHMRDGRDVAIDYREVAPGKATRDMYLDKKGNVSSEATLGAKSGGIPGTVAGLALAHAKFGTIAWKDLVAPAITLAEEGFVIDAQAAKDIAQNVPKMQDEKLGADGHQGATILSKDGKPLAAGDKLVQPQLAVFLRAIAKNGEKAFYTGELAKLMVQGVKKAGGIWEEADLASYKAIERAPITFQYRGAKIVTMPPPSGGGIVLEQLLVGSADLHLDQQPWRSADEIHLFAEAMRRSYADRNELIADPAFVNVPVEKLLDPAYIAKRMSDIDPAKATPSKDVKPGVEAPHESEQTTHFSVVDDAGNAVSNTYTLNGAFGSKFVIPGTGIFLNNEMDDFAAKPGAENQFHLVQGESNRIEPGKRMLSSMTPTILLEGGDVRAVVGSPGGPTISTTVAQIVRGLVDYGKPLDEVVPMFRAHHQWLPDLISTEGGMPADVEAALVKKGHKVDRRERIGNANCIEVDPETHGYRAVADTTRGGGKAAAY